MPEKFLIIQTAFIGDVVLTLPLIQVIKKNYPDAEIDFLCIPSTSLLLKNNPYINEVIIYDKKRSGLKGLSGVIKKIRSKKYDYLITPHRSYRTAMIVKMSKAGKTISFDRSAGPFMYSNRVKYEKGLHEIQRNLKLLSPLGIFENKIIKPELFPGREEKLKINEVLLENKITEPGRILTIAPGSIWFTKRFPAEKFIKLCDLLSTEDVKIFLIGSEKDVKIGNDIKSKTSNENIIDLTGKLSILESAELIGRSFATITNDSAPLHIANAMGTKVIALFGSTIPEFGFYPYGENDRVFEVKGLPCRPCTDHGRHKCPIGSFVCMNEIGEEGIAEAVRESVG
jgi:heptosyltransferase II